MITSCRKIFFSSVLLVALLATSCEVTNSNTSDTYTLEINPRLNEIENGFYVLRLDSTKTQTIHRISGQLLKNGEEPNPPEKVEWDSNLIWTLNDTTYIIQRRVLNSLGEWVVVDTSYVTGFQGEIVPTINMASYSGENGEINTVIAPIYSMKGDTMYIRLMFKDLERSVQLILQ